MVAWLPSTCKDIRLPCWLEIGIYNSDEGFTVSISSRLSPHGFFFCHEKPGFSIGIMGRLGFGEQSRDPIELRWCKEHGFRLKGLR